MPVNKYSEEKVETILSVLRETGSIKSAWKSARISRQTYYNWLHTHPPLVKKIQEAINQYDRTVALEYQEIARKKFEDYLNGSVKQVTYYETIEDDDESDDDGSVEKREKKTKRKVTATIPPPQWAIERVLGKRLALNDAITTFQSYGYEVKSVDGGFLIKEAGDVGTIAGGERSPVESDDPSQDQEA